MGEDFVVMEFIDGMRIDEFLKMGSPDDIKSVLEEVFRQLQVLDKNNLNKFEMTNPYKHIIIKTDNQPVMIDFERARFAARTKNVTQFAEYLRKNKSLLESKGLFFDKERIKIIKK